MYPTVSHKEGICWCKWYKYVRLLRLLSRSGRFRVIKKMEPPLLHSLDLLFVCFCNCQDFPVWTEIVFLLRPTLFLCFSTAVGLGRFQKFHINWILIKNRKLWKSWNSKLLQILLLINSSILNNSSNWPVVCLHLKIRPTRNAPHDQNP